MFTTLKPEATKNRIIRKSLKKLIILIQHNNIIIIIHSIMLTFYQRASGSVAKEKAILIMNVLWRFYARNPFCASSREFEFQLPSLVLLNVLEEFYQTEIRCLSPAQHENEKKCLPRTQMFVACKHVLSFLATRDYFFFLWCRNQYCGGGKVFVDVICDEGWFHFNQKNVLFKAKQFSTIAVFWHNFKRFNIFNLKMSPLELTKNAWASL